MRIVIDTNILLDVVLDRQPFVDDSAQVVEWAERNPQQAALAWHTLSNFDYLTKGKSREFLADLLAFTQVAAGDVIGVRQALAMPTNDFEDALQVAAALTFGAAYIVTRNIADYEGLPVPAMTPAEFVAEFVPD